MTILGAIPLDLDNVVLDLFDLSGGSPTINATTGRAGGNSVRVTGSTMTCSKNLASNVTTLNVAFAYKVDAVGTPVSGALLGFTDGAATQVSLRVLADGSIQAYRGFLSTTLGTSSPGVVHSNTQQHVETSVTISSTVGVVQVWVDSVLVLNLSSQNTQATANTFTSQWFLGATSNQTHDFSDIIWSTARINDKRVECVVPTGAGNYAQFTPSTGSNWQNVDEVPPNTDTDYNESATLNQIDSFVHAALAASPTPSSISAVIVNVRARNTVAGAGSIAPFVRSAGTDSVGTGVSLNTTYRDFQTVFETDPATGVAWANAAAVNAAEFGYKKTV